MPVTYAAIDIGSNAVRLLIKRTDRDDISKECPQLKKLLLLRVPLRLGFDVFEKGEISPKKTENLVRLMKAYRQLMKIYEVDRFRACATSAMRDAENGARIIRKIEKETDIKIEIIPGAEEARLVYDNHIERKMDSTRNYLYVDVGGGSTELNFIANGKLLHSRSFNIGTVRILTGRVQPSQWDSLHDFLKEIAAEYPDITIIGSGGNINKLYKMAETKNKEEESFSVAELTRIYHTLKPLSVEQRMKQYAMRADRADVIIPAAEIFLGIASMTGSSRIIVPTIGVADGIIDSLLPPECQKKAEASDKSDKADKAD